MKTILLVEDDPFICDIYSTQLKKEGFLVSIAPDGQAALDKIKDHMPDLLILDIKLPKMNGWEVLKVLRDDPKTENQKVIVISNENEEANKDNIANFKVIKFFLKVETSIEEITEAVKEILT